MGAIIGHAPRKGEDSQESRAVALALIAAGTSTGAAASLVTTQFLKFRISAGQDTDNLTTEDRLPWPKMTERAAEQLVKWIVENVIPIRP